MTIQVDPSEWRLLASGVVRVKVKDRFGEFSSEGATATEVYIIRATDLYEFISETFPAPILALGGLVPFANRTLPGYPALRTTKVRWKSHVDGKPVDPFESDLAAPDGTYEGDLELTIDYSTSPHNTSEPDPDNPLTFLEISANGSGEFLTCPITAATWQAQSGVQAADEAAKEVNVPHVIPVPMVEWTIVWSQIPYTFFNATLIARLRAKLGSVNSTVMTLFNNAPVETVLFTGWSLQQQYTWRQGLTGASPLRLTFKFLEKNFVSAEGVTVTHNHFYRPGKGWRRLLINGQKAFALSNLDLIFLPQ